MLRERVVTLKQFIAHVKTQLRNTMIGNVGD